MLPAKSHQPIPKGERIFRLKAIGMRLDEQFKAISPSGRIDTSITKSMRCNRESQMTAKFASNGLVCEMQIEQAHFDKNKELVPPSERGEKSFRRAWECLQLSPWTVKKSTSLVQPKRRRIGAWCRIRVSDVDQECRRQQSRVKSRVKPPTTQPWKTRSIYFHDPDGNLVDVYALSKDQYRTCEWLCHADSPDEVRKRGPNN
jgi:hypothetical protein